MEKRVQFDFEITFSNGGGIQGQGFRLDIAGETISDEELADYLVRDMRLLMVDKVCILKKQLLQEAHKRVAEKQTLVDLSHTIEHGLVTYKGLPAPLICDYLSREDSRQTYAEGTEFQIGRIEMVGNTGTYMDSPFHRYADGKDLSEVGVERLADLPGLVIRADYRQTLAVDTSFFQGKALRGKAVLVHTGWAEHWNTERYFEDHPYITAEAAAYLVEAGAALVGIDCVNIDDTRGKARPVHSQLLRAEILIVEHLRGLEQLPEQGFTFSALPPKVRGFGTFPVRALAKLL